MRAARSGLGAVESVGSEVAGVRIPGTPLAVAAAECARAALPPVLLGHARRVFVFAALSARRAGLACEAGALFVGALYANMGLSAAYARSMVRYELDGADAAHALLGLYGASEQLRHEVWLAIALHTTPGLPARVSPLARVLAQAVSTDLTGSYYYAYTHRERSGVLAAYPRGARFGEAMIGAFGRGLAHRPRSTAGTAAADVLDRIDPDYCRENFCGRILGSPWRD